MTDPYIYEQYEKHGGYALLLLLRII